MKSFGRLLTIAVASIGISSAEAKPAATTRYFYYLHGKIVEDAGPRGVSPKYGAYDYPGIVAALSSNGLDVVSEVRPKGTDARLYADTVVRDIEAKLRAGVPASHITVAGVSKGAVIASIVSTRLARPGVRYVLIANCNPWLIREMNPRLTGDVLSIYEATDDIGGTCKPLIALSPAVGRFREIRLSTGLGHGLIYRPLAAWVDPAVRWAKR